MATPLQPPTEAGEAAVDALYGEALDTFTAARNALAKALAQAGDRDGAAAIRALRKPSSAAWALNQVSRSRHADVERFLAAGEELRDAQHHVLEGGDPDRLREARRAHDDEVDRLVRAAGDLLSEAGKSSGVAQHDRLSSTLQAVASDDDSRELLRSGRLVHDLEPAGFGFADDLAVVPAPSPRPPRPPRQTRPRPMRVKAEPDPGEAEAIRREARRLSTAAERAEARAERQAREADEAERNAIELRRLADESHEAAANARRAADAASHRSERARQVP